MYNQPTQAMPPIAPPVGPAPAPSVAPSGAAKLHKTNTNSLLKTIIIVLLALLLIGALLLAYYFHSEYLIASSNVEAQIENGVTAREKEITDKVQADFEELAKLPHRTFSGPEDYGSLTFEYPKGWSSYVAKDGFKGGDYEAYLHPDPVPPIANDAIFALRVVIKSETIETASKRYESLVKSGKLTSSIITVNGQDATRYDGTLPNKAVGSIVIFRIRDKVVTLETDAEIYKGDFAQIISSIKYNQ